MFANVCSYARVCVNSGVLWGSSQVIVGDLVSSIGLIGQRNAMNGADAVFSALQSTHANKHLAYTILEKFMEHLLVDEISPRNLQQNLVVVNAANTM